MSSALRGVGSGWTGSVRGVNGRSWGGFPLPGALPSVLSPLTRPFLLSPLLYARARCGRRRLGQVRLSLGFNIGENTGFYLIARYVLYRAALGKGVPEVVERGCGWKRRDLDVLGCVYALLSVAL